MSACIMSSQKYGTLVKSTVFIKMCVCGGGLWGREEGVKRANLVFHDMN